MSTRPITLYGDPVLTTVAEPVGKVNSYLIKLVEDMRDTMYASHGVGLAAPQVSESVRLVVIDTSQGNDPNQQLVLINPEVVEGEGEEVSEEGCLSIPEVIAEVSRANKIVVRATTLKGKTVEIQAEGLPARALQHEIDHLNGRLIIDSFNPLQRDLFERKWSQRKPNDQGVQQ